MSTLNMPEPVAAYFAADRESADAVVRCFTANGVVKDEGRVHIGPDAIKAWKLSASTAYEYTSKPLTAEQQGDVCLVTCRVVGNFPGSPIDIRYRFHLKHGLIASLDITA